MVKKKSRKVGVIDKVDAIFRVYWKNKEICFNFFFTLIFLCLVCANFMKLKQSKQKYHTLFCIAVSLYMVCVSVTLFVGEVEGIFDGLEVGYDDGQLEASLVGDMEGV